uniref:Exocyst complex component SEC15B-like n=1 Tax=Elaeis guineensis var. tenera TaxID=51953 RepID=A0A6I9QE73_ELAGV|nr:exocyst complex component SEC15B-like [Elaeis guineensis]
MEAFIEAKLHCIEKYKASANFKEELVNASTAAFIQAFNSCKPRLRRMVPKLDLRHLCPGNSDEESTANPLLSSINAYLEAHAVAGNLSTALTTHLCVHLLDLLARANTHLTTDDLYLALRIVDAIERDFLDASPHPTIHRMLLQLIPTVHAHAGCKISKEFFDWMVQIHIANHHLG